MTIKDICRNYNAKIDSRRNTNFFCSRCYIGTIGGFAFVGVTAYLYIKVRRLVQSAPHY